jgi:enamidase
MNAAARSHLHPTAHPSLRPPVTIGVPAATPSGIIAGMRDFLIVSFLLTMLPATAIATMQFLTAHRWIDAGIAVLGWLAFPLCYWWPLGAWLVRARSHWVLRLAIGYVLSLPLYVLCLFLVYPAFGYRFDPGRAGLWSVYLQVSPWFYAYTVVLWLLVRRPGRLATATRAIAATAFVLASAAPFAAFLWTDSFRLASSSPAPTRIVNARIVDTASGTVLDGKEVHLRDGGIVAVVDAQPAPATDGTAIDAGGAFLVPGLIDVHAHLQTPLQRLDVPFSFGYMVGELFGQYADHRRQYLANGVTSVRDLGGPAGAVRELRDALVAKTLAGPRLFTVGRLVTSPGGHPVATIWTPPISAAGAITATDAESLARQVQDDIDTLHPNAVKIVYGTIGRTKSRLSEDLLRSVVTLAAARGLPSIVHAEQVEEVWAAVRSGATGVEHVASMESLPDELLALMKERRPFVDATFGEYRLVMTQRRDAPEAIDAALARARAIVKRLSDAGVPVVVGTDAPLVEYGSGVHDELRELVNAGLTSADVLRSVTVHNATYLGRPKALGQIAPGFRADLILVGRNPLEDVAALRTPVWTMVDGIVMWQTPVQRSNADGR